MTDPREVMQRIARFVAGCVPGFGFVVVVFNKDDDGRLNYASNCARDEVIRELRVCADTIERHPRTPHVPDPS